jgi:hypothetical protein
MLGSKLNIFQNLWRHLLIAIRHQTSLVASSSEFMRQKREKHPLEKTLPHANTVNSKIIAMFLLKIKMRQASHFIFYSYVLLEQGLEWH